MSPFTVVSVSVGTDNPAHIDRARRAFMALAHALGLEGINVSVSTNVLPDKGSK